MVSNQSALILGATGQVGRHLLTELLSSPQYSKVAEYGRRTRLLPDSLPGKEKLEQRVIDFENLKEAGLKDHKWDVVYITLGTTKADAGSAQAFEKIDREYVVNSAREAKAEGHDQRLVYVSSMGANAKSFLLYPKSKGLTELELAALGYKDTIILRPAALVGFSREKPRFGEHILLPAVGFISKLGLNVQAPVSDVAKAAMNAALLGTSGLPSVAQATNLGPAGSSFTAIENKGIIALAKVQV